MECLRPLGYSFSLVLDSYVLKKLNSYPSNQLFPRCKYILIAIILLTDLSTYIWPEYLTTNFTVRYAYFFFAD